MEKRDWIMVYLTLITFATQVMWIKAEKKVSFFEGREAVFQDISVAEDGVCGPYDQPVKKRNNK